MAFWSWALETDCATFLTWKCWENSKQPRGMNKQQQSGTAFCPNNDKQCHRSVPANCTFVIRHCRLHALNYSGWTGQIMHINVILHCIYSETFEGKWASGLSQKSCTRDNLNANYSSHSRQVAAAATLHGKRGTWRLMIAWDWASGLHNAMNHI